MSTTPAPEGPTTDLIDTGQLTLDQLRRLNHPALTDCLARILRDTDRGSDAVAGFQSSL